MVVNPLLISLCREYLTVIDNMQHGKWLEHTELHDMEQNRAVLHQQLLSVVNADDYEQAEQDTYKYAQLVVTWAKNRNR